MWLRDNGKRAQSWPTKRLELAVQSPVRSCMKVTNEVSVMEVAENPMTANRDISYMFINKVRRHNDSEMTNREKCFLGRDSVVSVSVCMCGTCSFQIGGWSIAEHYIRTHKYIYGSSSYNRNTIDAIKSMHGRTEFIHWTENNLCWYSSLVSSAIIHSHKMPFCSPIERIFSQLDNVLSSRMWRRPFYVS